MNKIIIFLFCLVVMTSAATLKKSQKQDLTYAWFVDDETTTCWAQCTAVGGATCQYSFKQGRAGADRSSCFKTQQDCTYFLDNFKPYYPCRTASCTPWLHTLINLIPLHC